MNTNRARKQGLPTALPKILEDEAKRLGMTGRRMPEPPKSGGYQYVTPSWRNASDPPPAPPAPVAEAKPAVAKKPAPPVEAQPPKKPAPVKKTAESSVIGRLNAKELRRAFILSEVLGKPVSKR